MSSLPFDPLITPSFPEGTRYNALLALTREFYGLEGLSHEAISKVIHQTNRVRCQPPLKDGEVDAILYRVRRRVER